MERGKLSTLLLLRVRKFYLVSSRAGVISVYSFSKCLLSIYCMSGSAAGARNSQSDKDSAIMELTFKRRQILNKKMTICA